ncbi:hypothetical protein [Sphingobium sp. CAP-1]|uniref:hypothetical protein n=1 Tax=Sphingobium sp. CAP-1 TaxID=2676077 RepID=UPI0012BB3E5E|nr:hypothetical protein [Sphingobium sp. CAP-1]QGP80858.1 hypothetical protein GL174_17405 [Sphingobium sp. CAP-1]
MAILSFAVSAHSESETISYAVREKGVSKASAGQKEGERMIAGLPYARGKSFADLDAYLRHLENNSAVDLPWWRQIRPGVYEHVKRLRGAAPEIATRAELMKRFGFSE